MNRPFKTYNGGKNGAGTYQAIINEIPPHKIFISGFAGNCGVMANKRPASMANIALDADAGVVDAWSKLPGITAIKADSTRFITDLLKSYPAQLLSHIVVFLDPPYLSEVRKSDRKYYRHEINDITSHERLLLEARSWSVNTLITHYPCNLYNDILSDWRMLDFQSMTRKGVRTDRLYMNFPAVTSLHDYSYIGKDFRERELYKKARRNMVAKFSKMPDLERNFLIASLRDRGLLPPE